MTDNYSVSYSFNIDSPVQKPRQAPPESQDTELFAFEACNAVNLPTGAVLLASKYSPRQLVVTRDVSIALGHCMDFRSLQAHAAHLTTYMPELGSDVAGVRKVLESVKDAGLLVPAREFTDLIHRSGQSPTPPASSRVFIITCDRPPAIERLLDSMLAGTRLDLHEGLYLVDDSRNEDNARRNQALVEDFNRQSPVAMHYFGKLERENLVSQLIEQVPEHDESIRFLLDQQRWHEQQTYGLSRTVCLLLSVGFRSIVLDDDVICTAIDSPFKSPGLDFIAGMNEAAFYPSAEAWQSGITPRQEDPLAGHLRCLGLGIPDALQQLGLAPLGEEHLEKSQSQILRSLSPSSSVLITQCGTYGDPGTADISWCFDLEGESLDRLLSTPPGIEAKIATRQYWFGRSRPTFSRGANMSQITGLDNTALLPPYFPAGRGEDLLFGAMTEYLYPDSMVLNYDWAIAHLPLDERKGSVDWKADHGSTRMLTKYIRDRALSDPEVSLDSRLHSLVLLLRTLGEQSDQSLASIYRFQLAINLATTARGLTDKLQGLSDDNAEWRSMLEGRKQQCYNVIGRNEIAVLLNGAPEEMTEPVLWQHLRGFFSAFAAVLEAWPAIRQAAASVDPYSGPETSGKRKKA
jgi:hypothetical protein